MERGKGTHMNPEQFYREHDTPTQSTKQRIWRSVDKTLQPRRPLFSVSDTRSFVYGIAASFLLLLSSYGMYHMVERFTAVDRPAELRFDAAYQSAIQEFERVLPAAADSRDSYPEQEVLEARLQQIRLIDAAIKELRSDIARTDLSPITHARLRQLYGLKLRVLLEIIEQGERQS
ncbi:MAG: hypothetical protein WEB37_10730 [Bacteroidota bacterium]